MIKRFFTETNEVYKYSGLHLSKLYNRNNKQHWAIISGGFPSFIYLYKSTIQQYFDWRIQISQCICLNWKYSFEVKSIFYKCFCEFCSKAHISVLNFNLISNFNQTFFVRLFFIPTKSWVITYLFLGSEAIFMTYSFGGTACIRFCTK